VNNITWKYDLRAQATAAYHKAAAQALEDAAEYLLEKANRKVPHEEGTLQRSGTVFADGGLVAVISYNTPYAVRQHEDTSLSHDEGREAKWLEKTFKAESTKIGQYIADKIQGLVP
jgi:hypothetical protein